MSKYNCCRYVSAETSSKAESKKENLERTLKILETTTDLKVVQNLGSGTFGDVYKVVDNETKANLAIKVIMPENYSSLEEAMWSVLRHENLLPLLATTTIPETEATVFLMPLQASSLHHLVQHSFIHQKGSYDVIKGFMLQVLCGLEYMHDRHMCHLDVKTDNILISESGIAQLCDFSCINSTQEPINREEIGLANCYRPPEACFFIQGEVYVEGVPFDMWSYGVMSLEILTGDFLRDKFQKSGSWKWKSDIYPILREALQEERFATLVTRSFPGEELDHRETTAALSFVHSFLYREPSHRASAESAQRHLFLHPQEGETGAGRDHIWANGFLGDIKWAPEQALSDEEDLKCTLPEVGHDEPSPQEPEPEPEDAQGQETSGQEENPAVNAVQDPNNSPPLTSETGLENEEEPEEKSSREPQEPPILVTTQEAFSDIQKKSRKMRLRKWFGRRFTILTQCFRPKHN